MFIVSSQESPIDCQTMQPTGYPSPCYLHSKCHQILYRGEQATHQCSDDHNRKDTPGCHNTLQYYTFIVQQPELPADCTPHLLYPSISEGFPILHERSHLHTMDYTDTATTRILSPHILPVEDFRQMLLHSEETLPSTMHLSVLSQDALHFYWYQQTHILIADEQFLLLINVPI